MGFDPRSWSKEQGLNGRDRVTGSIEDLIAENAALERENRQLRQQINRLESLLWNRGRSKGRQSWKQTESETTPLQLTASHVQHWGEVLEQQQGWNTLDPQRLQFLIHELNRSSFHSDLSLEQRLDRLQPRLGQDLNKAVGTPETRRDWAVLAAFALYGVRSMEWLDEDPRRVVAELQRRQSQAGNGRRTRSDRRKTDREDRTDQTPFKRKDIQSKEEARQILGLTERASEQEIKRAHRRLVKQHHPDMGGSAEQFRRVNEAYQYLIR